MSSAMNHAKRSHRSYHKTMSAMKGERRTSYVRDTNRLGGRGAPYIQRLRAFARRLAEYRERRKETTEED